MATDSEFVDFILDLLGSFGSVRSRRMFGGYGIFRDDLMFGLVSDDMLYLKVDDHNREDFVQRGLEPFRYETKGKLMNISYYLVPEECLDDPDEMISWANKAYAASLKAAANKRKEKRV